MREVPKPVNENEAVYRAPNDPEMAARFRMCAEQENADIMRRYNQALARGCRMWAMSGGDGSLVGSIQHQLGIAGLIPTRDGT